MFQNVIDKLHEAGILKFLLQDYTTKANILWAAGDTMLEEDIIGKKPRRPVQPRYEKLNDEQKERTKKSAEVFTPLHIIKKMTDLVPETDPEYRDWEKYLEKTFLEITCGEGAFLTTRYHLDSGEPIPLWERCGILDRKLRGIRENVSWLYIVPEDDISGCLGKDMNIALETCYGYEIQGDSLLIARINMLWTWVESYYLIMHYMPDMERVCDALNIITANIWQMDGLKCVIPGTETVPRVKDWSTDTDTLYTDIGKF